MLLLLIYANERRHFGSSAGMTSEYKWLCMCVIQIAWVCVTSVCALCDKWPFNVKFIDLRKIYLRSYLSSKSVKTANKVKLNKWKK